MIDREDSIDVEEILNFDAKSDSFEKESIYRQDDDDEDDDEDEDEDERFDFRSSS